MGELVGGRAPISRGGAPVGGQSGGGRATLRGGHHKKIDNCKIMGGLKQII
jgi:hypothetical protein